jgi:hypothetical protein
MKVNKISYTELNKLRTMKLNEVKLNYVNVHTVRWDKLG